MKETKKMFQFFYRVDLGMDLTVRLTIIYRVYRTSLLISSMNYGTFCRNISDFDRFGSMLKPITMYWYDIFLLLIILLFYFLCHNALQLKLAVHGIFVVLK